MSPAAHSVIGHGAEEMLEKPVGCIEKVAGNEEVFCLTIVDLPNRIAVKIEEDCTRIAKENGRVRRDEELRMSRCREVVDDLEERKLSLGRQRRLRLIQH